MNTFEQALLAMDIQILEQEITTIEQQIGKASSENLQRLQSDLDGLKAKVKEYRENTKNCFTITR